MKIKLKDIIWEEKEDIIEGKFKNYNSKFKEPKIEIIKQKDKYWWYYYPYDLEGEDYEDSGIAPTLESAKESAIEVIKDIIINELTYNLRICDYEEIKIE